MSPGSFVRDALHCHSALFCLAQASFVHEMEALGLYISVAFDLSDAEDG
jgi:hypothetical protein